MGRFASSFCIAASVFGWAAGALAEEGLFKVYTAWPFDAAEAKRQQAETAQFLKLPTEEAIDLGAAGKLSLVLIPAGEFLMGSTLDSAAMAARWPNAKIAADRDDLPRHRVRIGKPFCLGQTEVTRAQFAAFVQETGHKTDAEKLGKAYGLKEGKWDFYDGLAWRTPGFPQTDNHPAVCVSWDDARAFCDWLSKRAGKPFSLPTEAQWEFACRAGSDALWPWGDREEDAQGRANVPGEDAGMEFSFHGVKKAVGAGPRARPGDKEGQAQGPAPTTAPAGSFEANAFGLRDMIGNAWEWCADLYGPAYYKESPSADPAGPAEGTKRVGRGGSWGTFPWRATSSSRSRHLPNLAQTHGGFRVARSLEGEILAAQRKIEIVSTVIGPASPIPSGSSVSSKLDYRAKGLPPAGAAFTERVTWEAERKAADGALTWGKIGEAKHDRELKSPDGMASASVADPLGKLEPGSYRVRYIVEVPGFQPASSEVPFTVEPPAQLVVLPPVVKKVEDARPEDLFGRYRTTDPSRAISKYYGDDILKANGEGLFREVLNGQVFHGARTDRDGFAPVRWQFDPKSRRFVYDCTLNGQVQGTAYFEGKIAGTTDDFTLEGRWSNGTPGRLRFQRVK